MAVASLSLAQKDERERLSALQHYQQSLGNLKNAEDLSSDGAFLTHFLLLIYEVSYTDGFSTLSDSAQIAAADADHANMWTHHLSTLFQISLLRREVYGGERFPFIVWWICQIDLCALFATSANGEFVGSMLRQDLIPPPSFHLHPLGLDGSSVVYREERETLPTILQLDYEVTILAVRLALLAQEFRQEREDIQQKALSIKLRQSRIFKLQEALRQLWIAPAVLMVSQRVDAFPVRSKQLWEHATTWYRACIIYSHTSMWPGQRLDTSADFDTEIAIASSQILQTAQKAFSNGQLHCRFLAFPIFMAGYASVDGTQKMKALHLIGMMEQESVGRNTMAAKRGLSLVYDEQTEQFMNTGHSLGVDWMDVLREQGVMVVNFGL